MDKDCLLSSVITLLVITSQSIPGQGKNVIMGDTVNMECYIQVVAEQYKDFYVDLRFLSSIPGDDDIKIASYKPSTLETLMFKDSYRSRLSFFNNGQVEISTIGLPDEGTYSCHPGGFGLDSAPVKTTGIIVHVRPSVEVKSVNTLTAGSPLTSAAECIAKEGKPPAQVHWTTNSNLKFSETVASENNTSSQLVTVKSTLHVEPIKYYNTQPFSCTVKHPTLAADNVTIIYLNVTYPPETPTITVDKQNSQLSCSADGNPPVTYTWVMPEGAPSKLMYGSTVNLVDPSDPMHGNDTYMCIVNNGVGGPQSKNITTYIAINVVSVSKQSSVGPIVGGIIGGLVALGIIVFLVYFFVIKKRREKDKGDFQQRSSVVNYNTEGYTRPTIQHANDSLNKHRPPSPSGPPPDEKDSHSQTSSDSDDNGDVDLENDPAATLVDPASQEPPESGITSRSSMNFRARRKRPTSSPAYRKSRTESQMQRQDGDRGSPVPAPRQNDRYDMPPGDHYDNDMDAQHLGRDDYPEEGYNGESYPIQQQPQYVGYPPRTDSLPPYEPKYTELDHSAYRGGSGRGNPPYEEPVEYAQIRHGYSHIV